MERLVGLRRSATCLRLQNPATYLVITMSDQNEFNFEKPKGKIALAFEKYDANNPNVWRLFVQYSFQAAQTGRKTFSAQAIIERIRWFHSVENPDDDFKINNDFAAYYARKFHRLNPNLNGFFRTRKSQADDE